MPPVQEARPALGYGPAAVCARWEETPGSHNNTRSVKKRICESCGDCCDLAPMFSLLPRAESGTWPDLSLRSADGDVAGYRSVAVRVSSGFCRCTGRSRVPFELLL